MPVPLVSILIPAHNAARWLDATLESALAQNWPRTEIIVVENQSTDDTLAVARRYENRGVKVLVAPGAGAAAARNLALAASRGEMIQYLDADDLLSPNKISLQMADLDPAAPVVSMSARCEFFDGEDPLAAPVQRGWPFVPSHDPKAWLADLLGAGGPAGFVALHQWLAPRSLVVGAGPWNETLTVNDDGEFFCRVLLQAREIRVALGGVAYYRRHRSEGSLSSGYQRNRRHVESMIGALDLIASHLRAVGAVTPGLERALSRHYYESALLAHPLHPQLSRQAESQALSYFPAAQPPPPTSKKAALVRQFFGWRGERSLAQWLRRLRN